MVPVVILSVLVLQPMYLALLVALIAAVGSWEMLRTTQVPYDGLTYWLTALAAAAIPLGHWLGMGSLVFYIALLVLMLALFFQAITRYNREENGTVGHRMVAAFAGMILPSMLSALVQLKGMENGHFLAMLPAISAFLTDVCAYFVGMFLGKHRGITRVSPKKSLEGYIGGIVCGSLLMILYGLALGYWFHLEVSLLVMALYGLVGSAVTELGDLAFSLIKRQYGVKDYGTIFPGHGGMYDRFDSISFAAPTMLVLVQLLPAF